MLIYQSSATKDIQPLIEQNFDYLCCIDGDTIGDHKLAFKVKTQLHSIAIKTCIDETRFIFIDADCILLPRANGYDWFRELDGKGFSAWNNGYYNFESSKRVGNGYTFWFDVERSGIKKGEIPQINTSFIYFERFGIAKEIFRLAQQAMESAGDDVKRYKGAIPDEYCFNMACWEADHKLHKYPYHPVFFQFANEFPANIKLACGSPLVRVAATLNPFIKRSPSTLARNIFLL
jgi:hypothetical protein